MELKGKDWNSILRSDDVNVKFDTFCIELNESMGKYAPIKEINISCKCRYVEPWMTKGIQKASNKCKQLYKNSLQYNANEDERIRYKNYRNNLQQVKENGPKRILLNKMQRIW